MLFGHAQKLPSEKSAGILIKGSVIDKETLQPLEFATIILENKKKSNPIQGGITDKYGVFQFKVPSGNYDLKVEFIGFDKFIKYDVIINKTKDFDQIALKISQNLLNELS